MSVLDTLRSRRDEGGNRHEFGIRHSELSVPVRSPSEERPVRQESQPVPRAGGQGRYPRERRDGDGSLPEGFVPARQLAEIIGPPPPEAAVRATRQRVSVPRRDGGDPGESREGAGGRAGAGESSLEGNLPPAP